MNKGTSAKTRYLDEKLLIFKKICRRHGMKVTPQRVAIYKELLSSKKHPSAIVIYKKIRNYFPNISLGTVNNTLLTFADIGLAKVVESSGDPKRFDPNIAPHHHFRCIRCGKIIDFQSKAYDNIMVPYELSRNYLVLGKKVHLEGLCEKCRTKVKR